MLPPLRGRREKKTGSGRAGGAEAPAITCHGPQKRRAAQVAWTSQAAALLVDFGGPPCPEASVAFLALARRPSDARLLLRALKAWGVAHAEQLGDELRGLLRRRALTDVTALALAGLPGLLDVEAAKQVVRLAGTRDEDVERMVRGGVDRHLKLKVKQDLESNIV